MLVSFLHYRFIDRWTLATVVRITGVILQDFSPFFIAIKWQFENQDQLESHKTGLSNRPYAVVANKIDQEKARKNLEAFRRKTDLQIFPISAKNRLGLDALLMEFRQIYDRHKAQWDGQVWNDVLFFKIKFVWCVVVNCKLWKIKVIVYYISNEYNRNAGLTVYRCGLLVSIYVTIPLLDAALPLKSITKNGPMREFWSESI